MNGEPTTVMHEPKPTPERFTIVVDVSPAWNMPAIQILRTMLKVMLRRFGIKCKEIKPVTDDSKLRG